MHPPVLISNAVISLVYDKFAYIQYIVCTLFLRVKRAGRPFDHVTSPMFILHIIIRTLSTIIFFHKLPMIYRSVSLTLISQSVPIVS